MSSLLADHYTEDCNHSYNRKTDCREGDDTEGKKETRFRIERRKERENPAA